MRVAGNITITSMAVWLPEQREPAPAANVLPALPGSGLPVLLVESLPVADTLSAPEMAVLAAHDCLKNGHQDAARLDLLVHSWTFHQGHDVWPVVHYIADQIGASSRTHPVGVQQFCNGGAAGLHLAASVLLADDDARCALVTTADRFGEPAWHRWEPRRPAGFGDGATAALLTRDTGTGLSLLSVAHRSHHGSERAFRGEAEFTPAPMWQKTTLDATDVVRLTRTSGGLEDVGTLRDEVRQCLDQALEDAELDPTDPRIRWVVLPRIDQMLTDVMYAGAFDRLVHARPLVFGAHTGHLGGGDVVANAVELRDRGLLAPGQIAVLASVGAGWTWSTVVVQEVE
jgi:3-oxoacyl-[acyl-carrier-protein] synthase-3